MFLEAGFSRELRTALVLVEKPENFKNYIIVVRQVIMELERGYGISLFINNRVLYSNNRINWEVAPEVRVAALGVENNGLRAKRVAKDVLEARRAKGLYLWYGNSGYRIRNYSYLPLIQVNTSRLSLENNNNNNNNNSE